MEIETADDVCAMVVDLINTTDSMSAAMHPEMDEGEFSIVMANGDVYGVTIEPVRKATEVNAPERR